jgi:hypothetical protein
VCGTPIATPGQVWGFDDTPETFLAVASARLKLGPLWSPLITLVVVRHAGKEYACNSFLQGISPGLV